MSRKQQMVTGLMAVLMLATLLLMPAATERTRAAAQAEARSEQSHDVRYY
jgi:hypothetical protein